MPLAESAASSFQGEAMPRVINDGIGIHYRVEGDGPPLVLQHGFTDSSETWYERGYVDALKSRNRLILIDSRGHAESDKPHDPASYTAAKYASDVTAVIDDLGISKTRYWGYSQGGWIGFALARYAPSSISAFVIGGAAASTATAFPSAKGEEDVLLATLRRGPDELLKMWGASATPALAERLMASDIAALIAIRRQRLVTDAFSDVVGTIAVPTLLYAGAADPIHDGAQESASQIRGAKFISVPGLNHIEMMCRSELVLPHVEQFLTSLEEG
jgi:pimeloyl-ACP methyl ester carboxylesterase